MSLDSKQVQCWWAVGGKHRYNAIKRAVVKDRNEHVPVPFNVPVQFISLRAGIYYPSLKPGWPSGGKRTQRPNGGVSSSHQVAKYWSFSISISPSKEHPGLISFRMNWLDLLAVQGTLKSLLQCRSLEASIQEFRHVAFLVSAGLPPTPAVSSRLALES